jgi:hypothetical protein
METGCIMKSSKIAISVPLSAALAGAAGMAYAANPHFIRGPTAVLDMATANLIVSFKEVGLGNTPGTYLLFARESSTFCVPSRPATQAPAKASQPATTSTTITPHNGQTTGTISLEPNWLDGGGACICRQEYSGVEFQDTTNQVPSPPAQLGDFVATFNPPNCSGSGP